MEKEVTQMPGYLQDSRDKKNSENITEKKIIIKSHNFT